MALAERAAGIDKAVQIRLPSTADGIPWLAGAGQARPTVEVVVDPAPDAEVFSIAPDGAICAGIEKI